MTAQKSFAVSELSVGMKSSYAKTLSRSDVATFAEVSGDHNPVHIDEEFAATTMFRGCIAHGMLTGALLSTVIGTQLPGIGTIYLSQSLRFKAPVMVGDHVEASVEVTEIDGDRNRVTLACECKVGDKVVLDGEAKVLAPTKR